MVARHFLDDDELVSYLTKDPDCDEEKARGLLRQVESRDYNPPRRERILEWAQQQDFSICPDPDACNIYKNLKFPCDNYENIEEYHENKVKSERDAEAETTEVRREKGGPRHRA